MNLLLIYIYPILLHTTYLKKVDLVLVEIPQVVNKLKGLIVELEDSYFPNMGNERSPEHRPATEEHDAGHLLQETEEAS